MCCGRARVDEPLIGIRREVHGDPRCGRNTADYLDIEHDLTVRAIRAGWAITCVVHRNGDDLRRRNVQLLKIGAQVGGTIATAKLDDGHALALTVDICGEVVQLRNLRRCKRCAWGSRTRAAAGIQLTLAAYVRPGRWPVVQAEDALDDAVELGRDVDWTLTSAEGPTVGMSILGQLDAKRGADLGDGAAEHYAVPRRAGLDHAEPARARKGFDAGHVGGIGPMTLGVRLARQVFARL